ncbi:MAG: hypothetical protein AAF599_21265, partial [Bacteroidota bacterium]
MKNKKRYGTYLFILANALFWGIFMHNVIVEYYEDAEFYEKMEMLKEQKQYEAYIEADSAKKRELLQFSVPKERLEKNTVWRSIQKTLMLFLPFMALIYTNWLILIPRFLARKAYGKYVLGLVAILLGVSFVLSFHGVFGGDTKLMIGEPRAVIFTLDSMMEAFGTGLLALGFST